MDIVRAGTQVLQHQDIGLLKGLIAMDIPEMKDSPGVLNWSGLKLSAETWDEAKAFLQYAYDTYGGEAQVRLWYHESFGWTCHPMPQYASSSLHTEEIKDHAKSEEIKKRLLDAGYTEFGTIHSHCAAGAFQSGVDYADEMKSPGLHITVGSMHKSEWTSLANDPWTIHTRLVFRGVLYSVIDSEWLPIGDPAFLLPPGSGSMFSESWKSLIEDKPLPPPTTYAWDKNSSSWAQDEFFSSTGGSGRSYKWTKTYTGHANARGLLSDGTPKLTKEQRESQKTAEQAQLQRDMETFKTSLREQDIIDANGSSSYPDKFLVSVFKLMRKEQLCLEEAGEILLVIGSAVDMLQDEYGMFKCDVAKLFRCFANQGLIP